MFSREYCKIFKSTYFEDLRTAACPHEKTFCLSLRTLFQLFLKVTEKNNNLEISSSNSREKFSFRKSGCWSATSVYPGGFYSRTS